MTLAIKGIPNAASRPPEEFYEMFRLSKETEKRLEEAINDYETKGVMPKLKMVAMILTF